MVVQAGKNLLLYVFPSVFCDQDLVNESVAWDGLAAVEAAVAAAAGPSDAAVEVGPSFEHNVH